MHMKLFACADYKGMSPQTEATIVAHERDISYRTRDATSTRKISLKYLVNDKVLVQWEDSNMVQTPASKLPTGMRHDQLT